MIMVSSALRTRQTVTWVCSELGEKAPTPQLVDELYNAHETAIIAAINHAPETVRTLLVVAHMPGVLDTVLRLASRDSDVDAMMEVSGGFPTSGIAVLEVPGIGQSWMAAMRAWSTSRCRAADIRSGSFQPSSDSYSAMSASYGGHSLVLI